MLHMYMYIINDVECFLVLFCNLQKGVKKSSLRFQRTNSSRTLNLKDKVRVLATTVPFDYLKFALICNLLKTNTMNTIDNS